jgi:hypothetical protein
VDQSAEVAEQAEKYALVLRELALSHDRLSMQE